MKKEFCRSLFIFRRDLRLEDNTGLIFALKSSKEVIPAFIFTPEQIENNPYRSDHCLKFMIESLQDLDAQLRSQGSKLFLFKGNPEDIASRCLHDLDIDALIVNRDYTPYSRQRDKKLEKFCLSHHLSFFSFDDTLLHPPEVTLKKDGKPYTIFTPFFRNASKLNILSPVSNKETNYFHESIPFAENQSFLTTIQPKSNTKLKGGRKEALKILSTLNSFKEYDLLRNFPAEDYSTHLSPYVKFSVCSPREIYAAICDKIGSDHDLIRSLYWRDFFTSIAYYFPHVFGSAFHTKYDRIKWSDNKKDFRRWCEGSTGFPIVDAGMREMNETGFMHNRVRMVVGSFLVKDLHIDWRWGEKYFAQTLIDYDPAVNNGNWQWVASTGCDAQPYFRIFNPWSQQKKFDPECLYIKRWVPELRDLPPKVIHQWYEEKHHAEYIKYPVPMTDHEKAAKEALNIYKSI